MNKCQRCQVKNATYFCLTCNCPFCIDCDIYLHSYPDKNTHQREIISDNCEESSPKMTTESQNYYNPQQEVMTPYQMVKCPDEQLCRGQMTPCCHEICDDGCKEVLIENAKLGVISKLNKLNSELNETKAKLDDKIDYLHEHLHMVDESHKKEIIELNSRNLDEINQIANEKDAQIKQGEKVVQEQKDMINKLKEDTEKLESILDERKKMKENLYYDKEGIQSEKKKMEEFYKNKIDELNKLHDLAKKKLIADYERQMDELTKDYNNKREKYINDIQEKDAMINTYTSDFGTMSEKMKSEIERLKQEQLDIEDEISQSQKRAEELNQDIKNINDEINKKKLEDEENKKAIAKVKQKTLSIDKQIELYNNENAKLGDIIEKRILIRQKKG